MIITALCKVVDNFGDIGVVWRLCRNLKNKNKDCEINLIVDDLDSFNKICSTVDVSKSFQCVNEISIYDWNSYDLCYKKFSEKDGEKLSVILECFQCGRPEWMEKILFEDELERTVQIIMIDYLTAETYAESFHCLESLTRKKKVKKVNFMPGFTNKTGGLIIDEKWEQLVEWNRDGDILVFTYEKNWVPLKNALYRTGKTVLLAQGRGKDSFKKISAGLKLRELPFMNQDDWDDTMQNSSMLFIRGEESMSRACLSGIPFVWQAYPQSDEYQLVKVRALLERMKEYFTAEEFQVVEKVWLFINSPENEVSDDEMEEAFFEFISSGEKLAAGFNNFSMELRKNGDLCSNLMTFIRKICII